MLATIMFVPIVIMIIAPHIKQELQYKEVATNCLIGLLNYIELERTDHVKGKPRMRCEAPLIGAGSSNSL